MKKLSRFLQQAAFALTLTTLCSLSAQAGFSVSGKQLLDANGNPFLIRGVNHPHTWYRGETGSFADIAATGANSVRVVLATGGRWTRNDGGDVTNVISLCKQNKLVCILEVHDATGFTEQAGAVPITEAVDYWLSADVKSAIQGEEDYVIINIANEPYGNNASVSQYVDGHKNAIQALRAGGLTHTLIVDAGNWGQDWQSLMRNNAPAIFAADGQANTVFSVHMYEVYKEASVQESYIQAFQTHNLPLIIGEFGPIHSGQTIDAQSILDLSAQYNIGYAGWSWSGNGGCCVDLDLVNNFNANSPTSWGTLLIDGRNGIRETSVLASVYGGTAPPTNRPPLASFTSSLADLTATFTNTSSDPDNGPSGLNYSWDFGDGNTSMQASPTHTYASAGTYTVSLSVTDGAATRIANADITVQDSTMPDPDPNPGNGTANCEYVISNSWNSGFVAEVRISNNGTAPIQGWQVALSYTDGSTISNAWNADLSGSGGNYSATNKSYNGIIQPGQTVSFGMQGTHPGTASNATLSGSVCN